MSVSLHQVFHRILDKKRNWISIRFLFFFIPLVACLQRQFTFNIETKKSPEGLSLRKHCIPTLSAWSRITNPGTETATNDRDIPTIG
jgi:hypothetical protein